MAAGLVVTANGGLCKTHLYVQQPMKLEASSGRAVSSHKILMTFKNVVLKRLKNILLKVVA